MDLSRFKLPAGPLGKGLPGMVALGIVALVLVGSSMFQVDANSVGVVLRMGKLSRSVGPGLHFKAPLGIEKVYEVPVEEQRKEEFGFRTVRVGETTRYSDSEHEDESLMLTGDLNVVDVEWTVQYRISDPYLYLFRVRDVEHTLRYMSQAVMREFVGDRTVNEVLTAGRTELATSVQARLQELCNRYEMGIAIGQVILQDVTPPDPVKPSFNQVNQAQQEMERMINEARRDYNAEIPRARGRSEQLVQQAEGYELDRINRAKGEVARFRSLYAEYAKAPEITRQRIYLETMGQVLPKIRRKVILDSEATNTMPVMQLGDVNGPGLAPMAAQGGQR
ncbi:FtsH protease activity modulator HflK [Lujinxingia litoralis]|uniref:Protein HflK n=1 Tax=Lujinxingia litoralis TaxID=2211119 RepID=A0A328CDB0_9DELT|nr:FtsH protease activity modulator HflK [Lujinxingia litoralis]RAL24909.1 FtsH protease activity modulator HflK [Lujinxingia litoralis]